MPEAANGGSRSDLLQVLERQAAEIAALKAELAERRDQCRAVIDHSPYPTWVYSLDSLRFLDVNDVAIRRYGWTRDDFLSMTIADIRPREDVPALLANVARLRRNAGGSTGPWRHRARDGTITEAMVTYLSLPFDRQPARLIVAESLTAAREAAEPASLPMLSPRERQVFGMVARGHTSQEIADELALSPKSVETYRARFMTKLQLRTRTDIVRCAIAHGLLGR
jgi:PAS domain S-box-containing protein